MLPEYFHSTRARGRARCSNFIWPRPKGSEPGKWVEFHGELKPHSKGLHAVRLDMLPRELDDEIYGMEIHPDAEIVTDGGTVVVSKARLACQFQTWNERTGRAYACDCWERLLPAFEAVHPGFQMGRLALQAGRVQAAKPRFTIDRELNRTIKAINEELKHYPKFAPTDPLDRYLASMVCRFLIGKGNPAKSVPTLTRSIQLMLPHDAIEERMWQARVLGEYLEGRRTVECSNSS